MLQVRFLGQFDVRRDGKRVVIPSRAGQSLFAYLLLSAGTAHRRERLAGLLWPDTSDDNARKNLRQELWRVRKAIGSQYVANSEYIQAEEFTVAFNSEADYWLDVAQLDRPVTADDVLNDLINQLRLYQGELLPGFYDDWIVLERERVMALFENKMQQLMEALCQEQRWTTVLEWGERWIALGQTPEPAYRALMAAYAALGDRSKVVATFERCQTALEKELSVEPSTETRALYEELLKDEGEGMKDETLKLLQLSSLNLHPSSFIPHPLRKEEPPAPGEPPFKGLRYFDQADAELFFGRELLTAKLVQHVRESQFLAVVVGASGSGKSSIVRAGLIPALQKEEPLADGAMPPEGSRTWRFEIITPTAHPLEALALTLTRESESVTATTTLMDDLARDPRSLALYLKRAGYGGPASHLLLVIDQFEELFTLCHDEFEREAFIDNLLTALTPGGMTLILALRADFYAHLALYPELREAVAQQQEYIGPMTADELRRAIEEPAKHGGWEFESGLVDLMLRDIGDEPGALPLLSHALLETWKRRSGRTMTLKGYADAGGVRGAIAYTAESVYQQLSAEQQVSAHHIFLRLTELGEGTEDTRRRATIVELVTQSEQADQVRAVLSLLAEARLVTLHEDSAEVAHEALIREWPRLREWLNDDREGLLLHRHLTEAAHEWELLDRDAGALYRGARLAQASEWAAANATALNLQERAFLTASQELAQREEAEREAQRQRELEAAQTLAETQRQANRRLRRRAVFLAGAFILAIIMASAAVFFGEQANQNATAAQQSAQKAQSQQRLATSRELAAAAITNLNEDPERSILLALQAESTDDTLEARNALHHSILTSRVERVLQHDAQVWSATFSPDGKRVATASADDTAKIWDTATGQPLLTLIGHTADVNGIVFSPDGKRIATTSDDNAAKVWDASTGKELLTMAGHTDFVSRIAYSPDGTRLVTTSHDETIKFWNANTGKELLTFSPSHGGWVMDVGFSPDGKRIVTCEGLGEDRNVSVWDPTTGKELLTLPFDPGDWQCATAYSPDGKRIAVASDGLHFAKVWDATTGEVLLSGNFGHSDWLRDIAFSLDGKLAATGGADNTVNVWDAASGQVLFTLAGHINGINGVAFSPDGKHLASASWDHTARIWDITPAKESLFIPMDPNWSWNVRYSPDGTRFLTDDPAENSVKVWDAISGKDVFTLTGFADQPIYNIAYSPNGKLVAGSSDQSIVVWDAETGQQRVTLNGHSNYSSIAFSPDGTHLASSSGTPSGCDGCADSGKVIVWDLASGQALFTLQASDSEAMSVAYSPDGKYLLSGARDGNAIVWDAATGTKLATLPDNNEMRTVAYSSDDQHLAVSGMGGAIKVWDVPSEKLLLTLKGHTGIVNSVTYGPDGKLLASAGNDGTARVWDATTGVNLLTLPVDNHGAGSVSFSPDGKRLAVGGASGVSVFVLPIDEVVALAKSRLTRTLTTEECQTYLHVAECPAP